MENLPERKPLFDTFDWLIGIGAVPFQSPPIYVAAALLVIARHWSLPARGFFVIARDVFGVRQVTPLWCKVFPGLERYLGSEMAPGVMSNDEDEEPRTSTEPAEPAVVRSGTDAERTSRTTESVPATEPARHNYSRAELLILLAVQKDGEGKYLYSANKVADFVGGTRADSLNMISQVRGTKKEQPRTTGTTYRPESGW